MDYTDKRTTLIEDNTRAAESDIVDRLKSTRQALGLTQQQVADATGIDRGNIARMEGKKHVPSIELISRYAEALGYTVEINLVKK